MLLIYKSRSLWVEKQELPTRAAMVKILKKEIKEIYRIKVHGKVLLKKRKIPLLVIHPKLKKKIMIQLLINWLIKL